MNIPCENHAGVTEDIVICCYLALHTCAVLRITQEITQGDTGKVLHVGDPFVKEEVQRWDGCQPGKWRCVLPLHLNINYINSVNKPKQGKHP